MIKNAKQHLQSLRDGRQVFLNGEVVADVTTHPAYRNAIESVCNLYDFQSRPENAELMTYQPAESEIGDGSRAGRIWELPKSYAELIRRRSALEAWAAEHAGFMGRSPDHVASCISGMYMGRKTFTEYDPKRASALEDYYRFARDNDLYLTYVIINPQADRSKAASEQQSEQFTAGVVDEDSEGLTIHGAKMLATGGIMANEILVTCIQPLRPGDEKYAVSFAIPMNTKGLKILSRKSYEETATNRFDYPFSSRFDENDALIYFDSVKVPWERVFVDRNIEMCQKQFHATPAHVYQNYQAQIRLSVKLRFLAGIARRTAEINGTMGFPQVREILGQLAAEVGMVECLVAAIEARGQMEGEYFVPHRHSLYTAQVLTQQLYGKFTTTLRDLAGGGMIMLPSSLQDFANPEMADLIEKTQQSPAANAKDKVKFYRLAWDVVGSEFASRHTQYEMFYAGAQFVTKAHSFRTFDWDSATGMVDSVLNEYDLDSELAKLTSNE
jgi:4-hydroxyphenylacetate 3-monooxygenase